MIHVFSSGITKIQNLEVFLEDEIQKYGELKFHSVWEHPKASAGYLVIVLNNTGWWTWNVQNEARASIERFKIYDLSKYNNAPSFTAEDKVKLYNKAAVKPGQKLILVVDQTEGDASIALGKASKESFQAMLTAALAEPNAVVVVKTHPDVVSGKKRSCFGTLPPNVCVISDS